MPKKKSPRIAELDEKVAAALADLNVGKYNSNRAAARAYGISQSTFNARVNGRQSITESHHPYQRLSPAQEETLVKWIEYQQARGYPVRHYFVRELAEELLRSESSPTSRNITAIGESWVQRFIHRHPQLKTIFSETIEASRVKITKEVLVKYFSALRKEMDENPVLPENTYNMDETGMAIGTIQGSHVIVNRDKRLKYQAEPGRQEWVTVVECICGDGSTIPPYVIFKGGNVLSSWIPVGFKPLWYFTCNTKGWITNPKAVEWLYTDFDPATRDKAAGRTRTLFCDGHESHISAQFVIGCIKLNIRLLLLLPHSTHLLQPLDVGVFGPLKQALSKHHGRTLATGVCRVEKHEWVEFYAKAREDAMTSKNIKSAWNKAGLIPFNSHRITSDFPETDFTDTKTDSQQPTTAEPADISFNTFISSSSPIKATTIRSIHQKLTNSFDTEIIASPIKKTLSKLQYQFEATLAENQLLKNQVNDMTKVNETRKERKSGKRKIIGDNLCISTPEIAEQLLAHENQLKEKKATTRKRGRPRKEKTTEEMEIDDDEDDED